MIVVYEQSSSPPSPPSSPSSSSLPFSMENGNVRLIRFRFPIVTNRVCHHLKNEVINDVSHHRLAASIGGQCAPSI
ncbi:hypothetical protein BLOT_007784 [Blomia tropicalis]|nr:hypothetical protein BLOT_007784 [Blomia tropicalis]